MANKFGVIYAIAKGSKLCMSNEDIHALVYAVTGKDSLKELNNREVTAVATRLREIEGGISRPEKKNFTHGGSKGTERQRKKIYMFMKDLGWNEAKICKLAKKMFQTDAVEWLDFKQCSDLIEALKKIQERKGEKHV